MPRSRELKLAQAINNLSKYYGQYTNRDLSRFLATRTPRGVAPASSNGTRFPPISEQEQLLGDLIALLIDVSDGAYLLKDIVGEIDRILNISVEPPPEDQEAANARQEKYKNYMTILSDVRNSPKLPVQNLYQKIKTTLLTNCGDVDAVSQNRSGTTTPTSTGATPSPTSPQSNNSIPYLLINPGAINQRPNDPTKAQTNIGVILSHTDQLSIHNKFTTATSIFLTGIPGLELSRAMPYLDVQIIAARPAVRDNKLFAPSIYKFLLGGTDVQNNTVLNELQTANSSSNTSNQNGNYTTVGMEVFLNPQTLATTNKNDLSKRSTEIFDQFKPLLSIDEFSVNVIQAYAARGERTAKLSLTLHDRGRMSEIAELFRPDLIFGTQYLIDYGWIHPDGELNNTENVYADIINGMRVKEKFRVSNWNFNLTDTGQVKIDLDLATVGETNIQRDLVVEDGVNISNIAQQIETIVNQVSELRRNVFERNNNGSESRPAREVRGYQFLDTVNDAFSNIRLDSNERQQFAEFSTYLNNNSSTPDVSQLRDLLTNLYGRATRNNGRVTVNGEGSLANQVTTTVEQGINDKLNNLKKNEEDPFLISESYADGSRTPGTGRVNRNAALPTSAGGTISLGNLLLNFMGLSLATSTQFDEVQMIFYPFNNCAGFASRLNIANFRIDIEFFKRKYTEYILNNLSRSGRMTIQQFWNFLTTNIIDDHGARSYGLFDQQGGLWRDPNTRNESNNSENSTESEVYDTPAQNTRLACILRGVTPDGIFRMPQLGYYLESVPAKNLDGTVNEEKTILRMHFYDQVTDSRGGISQLFMADRNNAMSLLPSQPQTTGGTDATPTTINNRDYYTSILTRARDRGLVENVEETVNSTIPDRIRWRGGSREIKNFFYDIMPSIIFGTHGSTIKNATVSSLQDQAATAINIVNAPGRNGEAIDPNGEESGGLPLRVIPVEVNINSMGCPLVNFSCQYLVDFGTGTTIDNNYIVNGITHKINRGDFTTSIKLVPIDGFGTYRNYINQLRDAARALTEVEAAQSGGNTTQGGQASNRRIAEIDDAMCNEVRSRTRPRQDQNSRRNGGGGGGGGAGGGARSGPGTSRSARPGDPPIRIDSSARWRTNTTATTPDVALPSANQLGQIVGPDGSTYQITPDDLRELIRVMDGEGSDLEAVLWSFAQAVIYRRSQLGTQNTLGGFARQYSTVTNSEFGRGSLYCATFYQENSNSILTQDKIGDSAINAAITRLSRRGSRYARTESENEVQYRSRITPIAITWLNRQCGPEARRNRERHENTTWDNSDTGIRRLIIQFAQGQLQMQENWRGLSGFAQGVSREQFQLVDQVQSPQNEAITQFVRTRSQREYQYFQHGNLTSISYSGQHRFNQPAIRSTSIQRALSTTSQAPATEGPGTATPTSSGTPPATGSGTP
jgi:hypothetical protein